jgi:hypothetical protein
LDEFTAAALAVSFFTHTQTHKQEGQEMPGSSVLLILIKTKKYYLFLLIKTAKTKI